MDNRLRIDHSFFIFAAAFLLMVPLKLAIAWTLVVTVHELSHYIALKLCSVEVFGIRIGISGVRMETAEMTKKQEFICALAGPAGGLLLLLAARWMPCTAICAFVHALYNLLPVYPLDGGRALQCVANRVLGEDKGAVLCRYITNTFIFMIAVLAVILTLYCGMGILPLILTLVLLAKIKLANRQNK